MIKRDNILLLVRSDHRLLIDKEIGKCRVKNKQKIDQLDVRNIQRCVVMNQLWQKRRQSGAENGNYDADDPIEFSIKCHQTKQLIFVLFRQWFIHAVGDCGADAEFGQRQHRENVCECAVQAEICIRQNGCKNTPGDKIYQHNRKLEKSGIANVFQGVVGSGHRHPLVLFSAKQHLGRAVVPAFQQ